MESSGKAVDPQHVIYLLPGLGANYRAYYFQLQLPLPIQVLDYFEPCTNESIDAYTNRLIEKMDHTKKISIIGNSFGGMLSMEIAKKIPLHKHVLISSVKTKLEMPARIYLNRYLGIYKLISGKQWQFLAWQLFNLLGAKKGGQIHAQIRQMVHEVPEYFVQWGVHQVLNWQNTNAGNDVYHIHGDRDELFPLSLIKNAITIKGGTHIMVFTKPREVNIELMKIFDAEKN